MYQELKVLLQKQGPCPEELSITVLPVLTRICELTSVTAKLGPKSCCSATSEPKKDTSNCSTTTRGTVLKN